MSTKNFPPRPRGVGQPAVTSPRGQHNLKPPSSSVVPTWKQRSDQKTPEDAHASGEDFCAQLGRPRPHVGFVAGDTTVLQTRSQEQVGFERVLKARSASDRTRGNGLRLRQGRFRLEIGEISFLREWSGVGPGCPGQWGSPHPWRGSDTVWLWHLGTGFSRRGGIGVTVGLDDLRGLFQP